MLLSAYAIGYHGCEEAVGEGLLSGHHTLQWKAAKDKSREYDWLGTGHYFWENDPERAWEWASVDLKKQKRQLASPFVAGAFIEMRYCLDLTRRENVRKLAAAHDELQSLLLLFGESVPENKAAYKGDINRSKRFLDHAVIEHLRSLERLRKQADYDTIRSPFSEGGEAYKGAGFTDRQHMQICVINPACIVGFFRPAGQRQSEQYLSRQLAGALAKLKQKSRSRA